MSRPLPERHGWLWFSTIDEVPGDDDRLRDLFEATFRTPSGTAVLAHLRRTFLERRLSPSASNEELRHREGSRAAIAYIERLAGPAGYAAPQRVHSSGEHH